MGASIWDVVVAKFELSDANRNRHSLQKTTKSDSLMQEPDKAVLDRADSDGSLTENTDGHPESC